MGFPKKTLKSWKNADGSKFDVECNWYSMISQKDQNLGYAKKQMFFFENETWFFWNKLKIEKMMPNTNEIEKFLKTFESWVLSKKGLSRKKFQFFKIHWWWQVCCRMQLCRLQLDLIDFSKKSNKLSCFGKKMGFSKKKSWIYRK